MRKNAGNNKILSIDFEEFRSTYKNGLTPQTQGLNEELYFGLPQNSRVLVGYVPQENAKPFEQCKASEYYTRPEFPNTINLKEVDYFVPYFKGKGIRDIYKVHHINTCTKKDFYPDSDDERMRLLFQFKFVKHLFEDYRPHNLNIWYCFTDTTVKELIDNKPVIRFIDLFAGIGGIRLGLEQAAQELGYATECKMTSEIKPAAIKVLRQNHPEEEICGDITQIETDDIPSFDILCAGFPCQAFSMAGQRKGFDDNYKGICRGTLFLDVARICEEHKPKVIFCENVKGLTIHDKGRTFKIIKSTFENLGYNVFSQILNSRDFGVPQNRERIYIVCFRKDLEIEEFNFPKSTDSTKAIRDILEENPVSAKYYLSTTYIETLKRHRARHEALGHGFGYEIRDLDSVAGAIEIGRAHD